MEDEPQARRGAGRPRQLSLAKIVDAALELGLENVTLTAVAAKLGVKPAALYTYIDNRDALVTRVAQRLMQRPPAELAGRSWADVVRHHVAATIQLFSAEPQLLAHFIQGGFGPASEMPNLEWFLAQLVARGFTPGEALRVYRISSQIALGAAAERAHVANARRKGEPHGQAARVELARHDGRYPTLSACAELYVDEAVYFSVNDALEQFLASVAAQRGETLAAKPES